MKTGSRRFSALRDDAIVCVLLDRGHAGRRRSDGNARVTFATTAAPRSSSSRSSSPCGAHAPAPADRLSCAGVALALLGASTFPARAWIAVLRSAYLLVILTSRRSASSARRDGRSWGSRSWWRCRVSRSAGSPTAAGARWRSSTSCCSLAWLAGMFVRRPMDQARAARGACAAARAANRRLGPRGGGRGAAADRARAARRDRPLGVGDDRSGRAVRRLLLPEQEQEREALLSVEATGRAGAHRDAPPGRAAQGGHRDARCTRRSRA